MSESVIQLKCDCKNDPWGKKGKDSLAGQLWSKSPGSGKLDDTKPYSELWMGTYPTVPSRVLSTGELLGDYLQSNPQLVGERVTEKYGAEIPFLPKILSFAKALPLQIHPDKSLAEKLHEEDPQKFGDPNHKPEIAVALSKFELFAGFKTLPEIETLMRLKPLQRFVPPGQRFDDDALRQICKAFLCLEPQFVSDTIQSLLSLPEAVFGKQQYIPRMLERLQAQYSEFDNGTLVAVLLMNYMTLEPGEAACVPADCMHAWLSGDIVECMARSDNVLNTGFCPRPTRDSVELFARALTFKSHSKDDVYLPRAKSDKGEKGKTEAYAPPFSEFNVLSTRLNEGESEVHKAVSGPSLLVVTEGCGQMKAPDGKSFDIQEGYMYFVGQGVSLEFVTEQRLVVYRPYAE
ncbi:RmlC-like cupin domain-containing protein [Aspergillus ambiguus]|uniref:RmlC-like cupin domain-containing protein n=1 Tax=Aspergillus ambiguus TaxID=176160 RepID=UPI003CCD5EFD